MMLPVPPPYYFCGSQGPPQLRASISYPFDRVLGRGDFALVYQSGERAVKWARFPPRSNTVVNEIEFYTAHSLIPKRIPLVRAYEWSCPAQPLPYDLRIGDVMGPSAITALQNGDVKEMVSPKTHRLRGLKRGQSSYLLVMELWHGKMDDILPELDILSDEGGRKWKMKAFKTVETATSYLATLGYYHDDLRPRNIFYRRWPKERGLGFEFVLGDLTLEAMDEAKAASQLRQLKRTLGL